MNLPVKKYCLIAWLFFSATPYICAQTGNSQLQVIPQAGMPVNILNKNVFSGCRINLGSQYGIEIKKNLNKKMSISLEGQWREFSLKHNIKNTYRNFFQSGTFSSFNKSRQLNGLINISFAHAGENNKNLFEMAFGAGIGRFAQPENLVQLRYPNPANPGRLITIDLYRDVPGTYTVPIGQFSLQNTFYIKPCLGITAAIKVQYSQVKTGTVYTPVSYYNNPLYYTMPQYSIGNIGNNPFIDLKVNTQPNFTFIPTIGIMFRPRGCNNSTSPNNSDTGIKNSCFSLQWINPPQHDSCINSDSIRFAIQYPAMAAGAMGYEVYLAKESDLNNPKLLFRLAYPATGFFIHSSLLEAQQYYRVFVKLLFRQPQNNCLQPSPSVRRCANCCLDGAGKPSPQGESLNTRKRDENP